MRWVVRGIAGLMTAAFVGLAAIGGGLYWQRVETRGEQAARDALGPLAQKQIPTVFTYDYKTVEASLTDSELRVIRVVARGTTNRDAAEQLFLSPHTVSSHLRHAFTKLDINSRNELIRVVLAQDGGTVAPR